MSDKFNDILNELKNPVLQDSFHKEWLVTASASSVGALGSALTSGSYSQYQDYTGLKDYSEEIDLVSGQDSGIKGICISNVRIVLMRNQSSVQILKAFRSNCLLETIGLLQVMKSGTNYKTVSSINFTKCKITNAKIFLDFIEFYFKYGERTETYALIDNNGASQGFV